MKRLLFIGEMYNLANGTHLCSEFQDNVQMTRDVHDDSWGKRTNFYHSTTKCVMKFST